jgi:hypothetical protein
MINANCVPAEGKKCHMKNKNHIGYTTSSWAIYVGVLSLRLPGKRSDDANQEPTRS